MTGCQISPTSRASFGEGKRPPCHSRSLAKSRLSSFASIAWRRNRRGALLADCSPFSCKLPLRSVSDEARDFDRCKIGGSSATPGLFAVAELATHGGGELMMSIKAALLSSATLSLLSSSSSASA